ncbi:hypothetical protein evm_014159 [Chilo suppressalis]|nr:hypothetical protein evm_014159 [Chilo suppressalis]
MITDFAKEKVFWTRKMNLKLFASKYGNEFTGKAVKERWTNIRSTFANYMRKLNASRSKGDGEEYKINWHLWEPCQFLLKVNRKGPQNTVKVEQNDDENTDEFDQSEEGTSTDNNFTETLDGPNNMCMNIANNLAMILRGVQNDTFGLVNTKHGKIGVAVSKTLAQMSSHNAAIASTKIMQILLMYDKDNPENPNNYKIENKDL